MGFTKSAVDKLKLTDVHGPIVVHGPIMGFMVGPTEFNRAMEIAQHVSDATAAEQSLGLQLTPAAVRVSPDQVLAGFLAPHTPIVLKGR